MSVPCLLIRADAGPDIGVGHVMRMLALAQQWQSLGGSVTFLSRCEAPALRQRILVEGFNLVDIESPHPDVRDLEQTTALVRRICLLGRSPWLALDGYNFSPCYQNAVRENGCRTLVVDDANHLFEYHADILLNPNTGAETIPYRTPPGVRRLLGLPYALLRREFINAKRRTLLTRAKPKRVLVTLGGADPQGITPSVLRSLATLNTADLHVRVLAGSANPRTEELQAQSKTMPYRVDVLPHAADMPTHMWWADMAVAPVSSTCWELLFMQVPFVSIAFASCQQLLKREFLAHAIPLLEWGKEDTERQMQLMLAEALEGHTSLFQKIAQGGLSVDGLGVQRATAAMLSQPERKLCKGLR